MGKAIFMLIVSIVLNTSSLIAQHLEDGEISAYQFVGLTFQIVAVILLI